MIPEAEIMPGIATLAFGSNLEYVVAELAWVRARANRLAHHLIGR